MGDCYPIIRNVYDRRTSIEVKDGFTYYVETDEMRKLFFVFSYKKNGWLITNLLNNEVYEFTKGNEEENRQNANNFLSTQGAVLSQITVDVTMLNEIEGDE